jgi:hypothetical protein
MLDGLAKSLKMLFSVIPAKAGIQYFRVVATYLDSGFRRSDGFLRTHHAWKHRKWGYYCRAIAERATTWPATQWLGDNSGSGGSSAVQMPSAPLQSGKFEKLSPPLIPSFCRTLLSVP